MGIDYLDRVHRTEELPHVGPVRGLQHEVERELDGGRVDLVAVVEQDVLLELERVQQTVGRDLPRFGDLGDELAVGRDADEPAADVHCDPGHLVAGRGVKVHAQDLVAVGDAQGSSPLGPLGLGDCRKQGNECGERDQTGDRARAHDVSLPEQGGRIRRLLYKRLLLSTIARRR